MSIAIISALVLPRVTSYMAKFISCSYIIDSIIDLIKLYQSKHALYLNDVSDDSEWTIISHKTTLEKMETISSLMQTYVLMRIPPNCMLMTSVTVNSL